MPVKRTKAKRSLRLDEYRRQQLLEGPDACLLAGVGYLTTATFSQMDASAQALAMADMRADWGRNRDALLQWWSERAPDPATPDALPWAERHFGAVSPESGKDAGHV
ncbi:hypothetical protein IL54_2566 [Sphingobium sp. ba1]|jgi:hypothetical protein|uniref:hypothetical protein n=1 Tax=Sphingobium sp. ba1 TaxID=1522072 RepID=UPI000506AEF4|nr:hypothetical protein [Sphingobium sp. ba1]KFL47143.1 hypothetical protein IL54_2566 [Sphingobium sp. ba1]